MNKSIDFSQGRSWTRSPLLTLGRPLSNAVLFRVLGAGFRNLIKNVVEMFWQLDAERESHL